MTDRLTLHPPTSTTSVAEPPSASRAADGSDFRALLREAAESLARGEATLDATIARLSRGRALAPEELIALQATVYRHAAEVELAAKLVDKLTSAVRTTLTSQQ